MSILSQVNSPADIKGLSQDQLENLSQEIREFLIKTILLNGGHFAGNLGVVELTLALHKIFNSPDDKIIWDVGHQSYVHKMITGRKSEIKNIRNYSGISGFPKISESEHDIFGTGHSSTAISAALGIAVGEAFNNIQNKIIAVVGDGALTGGMSFEALNNLMIHHTNVLIIINDNHIGIDPNNGAIDKHLQDINQNNNIFTNLGIPYYGPVDGHDIGELIKQFTHIKSVKEPCVLHVKTIKGKGYPQAEAEQTKWHSASKFVKIDNAENNNRKWQDAFADILNELAENDKRIVGITPAMPSGSGMIKNMETHPGRFFDVGIAEQHAVTFAAGLSLTGKIPFLNIYSCFLQRAYDQLIHDVAIQNLHVVVCVDRAGLVGEDGPTHHGAFDIAFLKIIPNFEIFSPRNESEFRKMLFHAASVKKPTAIRYPKGIIPVDDGSSSEDIYRLQCLKKGTGLAIISTGITSQFAIEAVAEIQENISVYHVPVIKPLPLELNDIFHQYEVLITVEDGCISGGFGESVSILAQNSGSNCKFIHLGIPDQFISHGDNQKLYEICGYNPAGIKKIVLENISQSG